jgi:ElaB/YqjD/DUF883 family membrane-anchored ribosome-binding protein
LTKRFKQVDPAVNHRVRIRRWWNFNRQAASLLIMESHFPIPAGHQSAVARQRLMDDLSNLVADTELLLKATAGDVSDKAREARERMREGIESAKGSIVEMRRRGLQAAKTADTIIRDHTYESVLTALTIGVVVGFFLGHQKPGRD